MVFPGRRIIAAYGHPGTPSLGILGEQDAAASVTRIGKLADQYAQLLPGEKVLKAFEIIVTVAANNTDDTYSTKFPIEKVSSWVDTITAAGGYVMLDLQPGRQDFLTQAKLYEPLLKRPNVGLALDPEWRRDSESGRQPERCVLLRRKQYTASPDENRPVAGAEIRPAR